MPKYNNQSWFLSWKLLVVVILIGCLTGLPARAQETLPGYVDGVFPVPDGENSPQVPPLGTPEPPAPDNIPPVGEMISPLPGTLATTTITLSASTSDVGGGVVSVSFYVDGNTTPLGIVTEPSESGLYSFNWSPASIGLANGIHFVFAVIADGGGNEYETPAVSFNTDTTIPAGSLAYSTTNQTQNNVVATLSTDRPVTITNNGGANTYTFTDNGSFTFYYVDEVGHSGLAIATVTNIDRTPPAFSSFSPVAGSLVSYNTPFRFTDTERTSPRCSLDGLNYSGCGSLSFSNINGFVGLPQGIFVLFIKDTDLAGNKGTSSALFIKDTVTPVFVSATATDARTMTVKFSERLQTATTSTHYIQTGNFAVVLAGDNVTDPVNPVQPVSFEESDGVVTLHFDQEIVTGTLPTASLILNPSSESIADLAGNELTTRTVATLADGLAPVVTSAVTTNPNYFTVNFSESLQTGGNFVPAVADFTAYAVRNGTVIFLPIGGIAVAGGVITINVVATMYRGDDIHFSIAGGSHLADASSNLFNGGIAYGGVVTNSLTNTVPAVAGSGGGGGGGGSAGRSYVAGAPGAGLSGGVLGIAYFRFTRDLKYGQNHPDVKELQIRLTKNGFMASAELTTYFGSKTLAGVKKYQQAHNLPTTGFVGPMTRDSLNGAAADTGLAAKIRAILEQLLYIKALLQTMISEGLR